MHLCSSKVLALAVIVSPTSLFLASDISKISNQSNIFKVEKVATIQLPTLIVTTIYNKTPYDILLIDRLGENNSIILPAGKIIEVNLKPNDKNEMILKYRMPLIVANIMAKNAQYLFKKLDQNGKPERGKTLYFNLHTTGTSESFNLKGYVANVNGYCGTLAHNVNGYYRQTAEFALELSMDNEDIGSNFFNMRIGGKLTI